MPFVPLYAGTPIAFTCITCINELISRKVLDDTIKPIVTVLVTNKLLWLDWLNGLAGVSSFGYSSGLGYLLRVIEYKIIHCF
jgi:hypothetical protein